ncbi:chondroadherin-like protein [Lineus longissimus]|uniref:chondroadherin-like protein n=1 Tax=Lineus longissimus TaxID=88925 RepID=UPI002B4E9D28
MMCSSGLFFAIFILAFLLPTSTEEGPTCGTDLPKGCNVTSNGTALACEGASFHAIFPTIRDLGEDLIKIDIKSCEPAVAAKLNRTCFRNNTNLLYLSIKKCAIEEIAPGAFEELGKLTDLRLLETKVRSISKETFKGLTKLSRIDLYRNHITTITKGTFEYLGNLLELDLSHNRLAYIEDGSLGQLQRLEHLYLNTQILNYGGFKPSPYLMRGMTKLKRLHFSKVLISFRSMSQYDIANFFKDQKDSLEVVSLESVHMTNQYLPVLKSLKRLRILDLSQNEIDYIGNGSLPKLAQNGILNLGFNKITFIDAKAFPANCGDLLFKLEGNSFTCNCKLVEFAKWLRHYNRTGCHSQNRVYCSDPVPMYGTRVVDYAPYWWQCSRYMPLIALVAVVGLAALLALITLVISCHRVDFKHWLLERRAAAKAEVDAEQQAATADRTTLVPAGRLCGISSLPKGMTSAYILYNMNEEDVKRWVDRHIEEKLYNHPMKITLQWSAGPDYIPLWKQVKEYGFGVRHFLVLVTEGFLQHHWPLMSENGGVENLSKFVLVLWGVKKKELPKDLLRLRCPCIEWPVLAPKWTTLQREREQFWKRVRLALKDLAD